MAAKLLLVNIKRGESHVIPGGDTLILAGDYINILTGEKQARKVKRVLLQMAEYGHRMMFRLGVQTWTHRF
ncbi:MAG: TrkA C-terminal domain-containing protein [Syntrophomonas sp.]